MFVAQAHSFQQQSRLAITLSWIAGYTNVLTLLLCGQVTSHITGTASQLGRDVAEGRWGLGAYMAALLAVFLCGAALSGFLTETGRRRGWASIYVLPMAVEAVLLAAFAALVEWRSAEDLSGPTMSLWLTLLPSLAMGLQNATITRISGGSVRTTHVTGVVTDLGMEAAVWAMRRGGRDLRPPAQGAFATGWRLLLLASVVGSFALGAGLSAVAHERFGGWSMVPAVAFLAWIVVVDLWRPIAAPQSNKDVGGDLHDALPAGVSVFHIAGSGVSRGRARMPNLSVWSDRLGEAVRVVVLDVSAVEAFDENVVLELRTTGQRLRAEGRALVIAGVTPPRYARLRDAGVLAASNVCADLDLAAAHAMSLLERPAGVD